VGCASVVRQPSRQAICKNRAFASRAVSKLNSTNAPSQRRRKLYFRLSRHHGITALWGEDGERGAGSCKAGSYPQENRTCLAVTPCTRYRLTATIFMDRAAFGPIDSGDVRSKDSRPSTWRLSFFAPRSGSDRAKEIWPGTRCRRRECTGPSRQEGFDCVQHCLLS
jgi:hypothetical protein